MPDRRPGPHALAFGTYLALMTAGLAVVDATGFLALYAALLLLLGWLVVRRMRLPSDQRVRQECLFYAVAMNGTFQAMAGAIPAVRGSRYDAVLRDIDLYVFGVSPNAVLVARTTNPAWTPLFYKAGAVITESGGPLSHGAVTAREIGLPAVMSVKNVLSQLKNGQIVTVDGGRGDVGVTES